MIGFVSLFILLLNKKSLAPNVSYRTCDVKTMCYIVFIPHSLHWRYIKTALQEYVINSYTNDIIILLNFIFTDLHGYQITPGLSSNKQRRLLLLKTGIHVEPTHL